MARSLARFLASGNHLETSDVQIPGPKRNSLKPIHWSVSICTPFFRWLTANYICVTQPHAATPALRSSGQVPRQTDGHRVPPQEAPELQGLSGDGL